MSDKVFTTAELIAYCKSFNWTRKPQEIHWHHTWKPNHKNFNGNNHLALQQGMRNSHINTNKWSDIGQHLTLMPDGRWVTGRDFNRVPASISGRNNLGFAIEMLGNFDIGNDKLEGQQLASAIEFGAFLMSFFKLSVDKNNIFHREYAPKTCPGTSVDKNWFIGLIRNKLNPPKPKIETKSQGVVTMNDISKAEWAINAFNELKEKGYINGEHDLNSPIKWGEFCAVMNQIVKKFEK